MASREFDPYRLDVAAFAKEQAELDGRWPLVQFDRLIDAAVNPPPDSAPSEVSWTVRGERRAVHASGLQTWLHLGAAAGLRFECQRCLNPVDVPLQVERSFRFVHGEDAAASLDAESAEDVLPLTRALDLRELIEDELLLALPLVPLHEVCPEPLPIRNDEDAADDKPNPFAALGALKCLGPFN